MIHAMKAIVFLNDIKRLVFIAVPHCFPRGTNRIFTYFEEIQSLRAAILQPSTYVGGSRMESGSGFLLSRLRFIVAFLSLPGEYRNNQHI